MRHRILFTVALSIIISAANAQFYIGAKAGLNIANVSANIANTSLNKKIGVNGGATVKYNFNNTLGVQMDVLFSQMGTNTKSVSVTDDGNGGTITTVTENLYDNAYLQIPVYANYEIPIKAERLIPYRLNESVASIHLYGGGYFGYGISNSQVTNVKTTTIDIDGNTTIDVAPKATVNNNKFFNAVDFGIAVGAGVSFKLSRKGRLTVDARYLMGVGSTTTNILFYPDMKNQTPQIQLGYIHRISRLRRWQIQ